MGHARWLDRRLLRFVVVGVVTAVVDVGCVALLLFVAFPYPVAISAAFLVALAVNYLLHADYTFSAGRKSVAQATRYLLVVLLNYALTMLIVWLGHSVGGFGVLASKIASLPIVTVVGYLASKHYVFKTPG